MSILSDFLSVKRQQRGLTIGELSAKTGLRRTTIVKIEAGTLQPSLADLVAIAIALDLNHGQVRGYYGRLAETLAHEAYNETLVNMGVLKSVEAAE